MHRHPGFILIAVICALVWPAAAHAYKLSPLVTEIQAEPGKSYTAALDISGSAAEPEQIILTVSDWDKLTNGDERAYKADTLDRACGSWIKLDRPQITARAGAVEHVKISFTVPVGASGTYWTAITAVGSPRMMNGTAAGDEKRGTNVEAKLSYVAKVFINVTPGGVVEGKISAFEFRAAQSGAAAGKKTPQFDITFHNSGNLVLKPSGYIEIRNMDGETLSQLEIPSQMIALPMHDRVLSAALTAPLPPGEYIALAVLDYGGENLVAGQIGFEIKTPASSNLDAGPVK